MSPRHFADGKLARKLETDIAAIERNEPAGWKDLASHAYRLDGEHAETFAVACAYLLRRDPTIFLRRHLTGDPDALFCGWAAYGHAGHYRSIVDAVYKQRLHEASSEAECESIRQFIMASHKSHQAPEN
ncbi:hypothetical protein [Prosthecobacter fluviatilis]|uniref:hypothetical protein n=1 Tax=Prosthecobacter fluviatilis TaxID=445931 RepID=UPI00366FDA06